MITYDLKNDPRLKELLIELLGMPMETEWLEFKEARNGKPTDEIGQYFSALSNEANLKDKKCGWLIFGIEDKEHKIVGTQYRQLRGSLDGLKLEIFNGTNSTTFDEIYELEFDEGRVILFQIPPAPKGIPTSWKGHFYGRSGSSRVALGTQKYEKIRNQSIKSDWSAVIVKEASIEKDLDLWAIRKAREEYKKKNEKLADDVDSWNDVEFLNKARITIDGKVTRSAIILLGKPESEKFLSPSFAKISWILKDKDDIAIDYEHFGPPLILSTGYAYDKIRNLKYRHISNESLFPIEISKYDPYVIREAIHNCIAHQDYQLLGKINIIEKPDEVIFSNLGEFIPNSFEEVINKNSTQEFYRNRFLVDAMVNLNMIDTIGSGIKKMFLQQKNRYFPMPDFHITENKVEVTIHGKVIDENYTKLLMCSSELDLRTVILLDKIQKRKDISMKEIKLLRINKLIEGRNPNFFVSSKIAAKTGDKSKYIKNRAFDNEHYKQMIIAFIEEYGSASRQDINELISDKLSDALNEKQKISKINNLIFEMSKGDLLISNKGSKKKPVWVLNVPDL